MDERSEWYVGVDLGSRVHRVVVVNEKGAVVQTRSVEHNGVAQRQFVHWLSELAEGRIDRLAVGMEAPRGAMPVLAFFFSATRFVSGAFSAHLPGLLQGAGATEIAAIAASTAATVSVATTAAGGRSRRLA